MSKCITVLTPFGVMYLTAVFNGQADEYRVDSEGDSVSVATYHKLTEAMSVPKIQFFPFNDSWVVTNALHAAFLPIVARHGNTFP